MAKVPTRQKDNCLLSPIIVHQADNIHSDERETLHVSFVCLRMCILD